MSLLWRKFAGSSEGESSVDHSESENSDIRKSASSLKTPSLPISPEMVSKGVMSPFTTPEINQLEKMEHPDSAKRSARYANDPIIVNWSELIQQRAANVFQPDFGDFELPELEGTSAQREKQTKKMSIINKKPSGPAESRKSKESASTMIRPEMSDISTPEPSEPTTPSTTPQPDGEEDPLEAEARKVREQELQRQNHELNRRRSLERHKARKAKVKKQTPENAEVEEALKEIRHAERRHRKLERRKNKDEARKRMESEQWYIEEQEFLKNEREKEAAKIAARAAAREEKRLQKEAKRAEKEAKERKKEKQRQRVRELEEKREREFEAMREREEKIKQRRERQRQREEAERERARQQEERERVRQQEEAERERARQQEEAERERRQQEEEEERARKQERRERRRARSRGRELEESQDSTREGSSRTHRRHDPEARAERQRLREERATERAIRQVEEAERAAERRAERRRRRALEALTSGPPPRDEYSTIDEDIPPYRESLHKYLDLVAYDERFTPILRVNRYLVNGDHDLVKAIDQLSQTNLLPKTTDLWNISHVDDSEYDTIIPVLIPENSYYENELAGFVTPETRSLVS